MTDNAEPTDGGMLELGDSIIVETEDGEELEFEVVGIVEDEEEHAFAVCYCEALDTEEQAVNNEVQPFIVTDLAGELVRDPVAAQAILDDFLVLASQEDGAEPSNN